ncbi:amino acid permease [Sphingomonas jatrophae]|uniref:Amino acid/polyamine/organocation transporter, APC superfamily n=1 Tax=Sphingomonas jatrophae TaxID=1166337 RepID=A0A1I6JVL0_9SPHN|nr:amino acid permease [Sphingomonas jatrophae]SFR83022.1 amino acid/polyamine/organocation transporter, APC superfamily [Sphingomonas jatrophae]
MSIWGRRKAMDAAHRPGTATLRRTLGWPHLVALGVGAIVGTGILTLTGVGAGLAGPGVILSFVIAGAICACAALCYAELATMIPASGSAYTYSYVAIGERVAWIVGWSLILEYSVVCSTVAVGWSGYFAGFMQAIGLPLPAALAAGPDAGGVFNLPAVLIVAAVAGLLLVGTRESATLNAWLVLLKLAALVMFVVLALPHFDAANFNPLMPYGFFETVGPDGGKRGVMAAAAIIFFAFYGFDAVSTAAEEAKDPGRDMTIGIVGSMAACVLIYMAVAAAALGALPFGDFAGSPEPLAHVLRSLGQGQAAKIFGIVAIVALPTVILAFLYGQTRIFFVMARDGLLPERAGAVDAKSGVPVVTTVATAAVVAAIAAFLPLGEIAALANAGTLAAFVAVGASVMILRRTAPDAPRRFRLPAAPLFGWGAILGCLYLFLNLPTGTQLRFLGWNVIGFLVYVGWAARHSRTLSRHNDGA